MITDRSVPENSADQAFAGDLSAAIAAIADRLGLLVTSPGKIIIIAGHHRDVQIRTLRSGAISLGDLQLGRALCSAGAHWATWAAQDLVSGKIEADLCAIAEGRRPLPVWAGNRVAAKMNRGQQTVPVDARFSDGAPEGPTQLRTERDAREVWQASQPERADLDSAAKASRQTCSRLLLGQERRRAAGHGAGRAEA